MSNLLKALSEQLGDQGLLCDGRLKEHPACTGELPLALIRPESTEQLSAALKLCHAAGQAVVPQGGRTGLVGGTTASSSEVIVSLERMSGVVETNTQTGTMTVLAGTPLQIVQEAAQEQEMMFPLDLGARGTATIGGNIATNAGGNRVLRYGMMRELVLGLEAVLADGTVVSSMNQVIKNNAGYDLKQLFIGSEGTLGIVTRAVLRLRPLARSQNTAMLAVSNFDKVIELLHSADSALGGSLSSFEVMWNSFYHHVTNHTDRHIKPLPDHYPYYVIVEAMGSDQGADDARFSAAMERLFEAGLIDDAVLVQSVGQREAIWAIRDDIESLFALYPLFVYDISVPLDNMETYLEKVESQLENAWPDSQHIVFGHLGDGNIHLAVAMGSDAADAHAASDDIVYGALRGHNGVISAEHGIGLEKKAYLDVSRSSGEIALMQALKQTLDPKGILNPGKIFDIPG